MSAKNIQLHQNSKWNVVYVKNSKNDKGLAKNRSCISQKECSKIKT